MNLRIVMLLMTLLKKNRLKNNYTLRLIFDYRKEDLEQLWEHGRQEAPFVFGCCLPRSLVSLPCLCLLRFGSTNNYHRRGAKSTDFFVRSEYFSAAFVCVENPYSLFTAAQFLRHFRYRNTIFKKT